jgi:hypothetical protein
VLQLLLGCSFDSYPLLNTEAEDSRPVGADIASSTDSGSPRDASDAGVSGERPDPLAVDATPPANASPDATVPDHDAALAVDASDPSTTADIADASSAADATPVPADATTDPPDATTTPTDASPSGSCRAGTYAGDFMCMIDPTGVTPQTVMMRGTFTLQQSSAPALTVTASKLSFELNSFTFAGELSGALDCMASRFHADIVKGTFMSPLLPVAMPFTGLIDGQLDAAARTLAGSWSFTATSGAICSGPWSASLQP